MRDNTITAVAGDKMYIKTENAVQYDHGLKLLITGVQLPPEYDVHFCNTDSNKTKTQTGDANGVDIPDEYLLSGEDVHAWLYLHTGEDDGESVYHIHIPVVGRAAIGEESLTPVEHGIVEELQEEVGELTSNLTLVAESVNELLDHETYDGDGETIVEYDPIAENTHVDSSFVMINGYNYATISTPTNAKVVIYPVEQGKTYKVVGRCKNAQNQQPLLVVADSVVTSGAIGDGNSYDKELATSTSSTVEEKEYTALRTGYLYITASTSDCGLWLKKTTTQTVKKYHIDDVVADVSEIKSSIAEFDIIRTKEDSTTAMVKNVPRNAEQTARVTSVASTVTLVRSIVGRNLINKNAVGDVVVDASGTLKVGMKTVHVPAGRYYCILGNVGNYTMVKKVENGIYTTLYKDQFPMKLSITDPAGGYFIVYASSVANLGDISGVFIGLLMDDESTLSFEAYSEKTYTPHALALDNRIEVRPYGFVEFVNARNVDVASTIVFTVVGRDDDTTTRKTFITSPDGSKFLPMVKNDGTLSCARVVPKKHCSLAIA